MGDAFGPGYSGLRLRFGTGLAGYKSLGLSTDNANQPALYKPFLSLSLFHDSRFRIYDTEVGCSNYIKTSVQRLVKAIYDPNAGYINCNKSIVYYHVARINWYCSSLIRL